MFLVSYEIKFVILWIITVKNNPKVSVITFVYANATNGRAELLVECLESVKNQGIDNYEHLIIDDGSDIDLSLIIAKYPMARLVKKLGTGILSSTFTFNMGHQLAQGEYCIYLPSDDLHMPKALPKLIEALDKNADLMMVIGNAVYEYENGRTHKWTPSKKDILENMSVGNYVNGCAVMWRKNEKLLGDLPPNYTGFCSDYDFWCTIIRLGGVDFIDVDVVKYRLADDSTRHKTRKKLITSPRAADKLYYQYSKASRIEMVKNRFVYSPHMRAVDQPSDLMIKTNIESVSKRETVLFKERKWQSLHDSLIKNTLYENAYQCALKEIELGKNVITVQLCGLAEISLLQRLKEKVNFNIAFEGASNGWVFDYVPVPFLVSVLSEDEELQKTQMKYLGV